MTGLDHFSEAYNDSFPYAFDNRTMMNWYPKRLIENAKSSERVLELGVGHGYTCNLFADYFASYHVIDGSPAIISRFREHYPASSAVLHEGYFEDFEPDQSFDLIVMGFILEHVQDPSAILERYRQFLIPGGRIAVAVPNAQCLHRRIGHAAGLLPDMLTLGDADQALGHLRTYTLDTISTEIKSAGYHLTRLEGIFLKPLMTSQLTALDLSDEIIEGMCRVGVDYPELSAGLLVEAVPNA
jgi:trans-aconitate methyltransferase